MQNKAYAKLINRYDEVLTATSGGVVSTMKCIWKVDDNLVAKGFWRCY